MSESLKCFICESWPDVYDEFGCKLANSRFEGDSTLVDDETPADGALYTRGSSQVALIGQHTDTTNQEAELDVA